MRIGVMMFPTDLGIQPIELAREAEARGFDSLWFPEHSHIPTSRAHAVGRQRGRAAAARGVLAHARPVRRPHRRGRGHHHARLGTGITLVAQRDPLWLAKEVASLDVISGGRFLFGIGFGWNHEEMEIARRRHRSPARRRPREDARLQGAVDAGRGRVPRQVRQLRAVVGVAEAGPVPAPADRRRRLADGSALPPHRRVRRRVDADRGPLADRRGVDRSCRRWPTTPAAIRRR